MTEEWDLANLKRFSIRERENLVKVDDFAQLEGGDVDVQPLLDSLPNVLAGREFREMVARLRQVVKSDGGIVFAMGAHVVKCGLSPVVIDLMHRGIVTAIALNGAGAIHDYEIALIGETSEDVAETLADGRFGMARETAGAFARAARIAHESERGLGTVLGDLIVKDDLPFARYSILAAAAKLDIPLTVHVAIGTDVVHMHPEADGADIGAASLEDFRSACRTVMGLGEGAWCNIGSAVILPEVFLKAVSVARNLGADLDNLVTVNLDMYDMYRPRTNVVGRPAGKGFQIIGRHEIMLPLLRLALISGT
jgi:deoxyhypusine synthase